LTGLEVIGKRVVGGIIVVEVRLNVNLMALTIEQVRRPFPPPGCPSLVCTHLRVFEPRTSRVSSQVIAKMQRSHIQMLDTMIDRQKQDLTEEEVGPLLSLKDKAEAIGGEWFNSPDHFEEATNKAMEAQREIVIEGVKNSRLRGIDASQLRSAANFAAKSNKPMLALRLLTKAAESCRASESQPSSDAPQRDKSALNSSSAEAVAEVPDRVESDRDGLVDVAAAADPDVLGIKYEVDGTCTDGSLALFNAGLHAVVQGEPDPVDPMNAMRKEHTSAADANYWFNGAKRHLLDTPDDQLRATTPFIEWFFVHSIDSSKNLGTIPFSQFKDMPPLETSLSAVAHWWPLIATPAQKQRKILPENDGDNMLRWPFEAEEEPEEATASDVQRTFMSFEEVEAAYKMRMGLTADTKLTAEETQDKDKAERIMDFELVGARLYTGPMFIKCAVPGTEV
jgi:hypothetical protein